ncbi:MAG TPA: GMC oxidoreductase [Vicinamibacterales bacterium]
MTCHEFARLSNGDRASLSGEARQHLSSCPVCAAATPDSAATGQGGPSRRGFLKTGVTAMLGSLVVGVRRLFGQQPPVSLPPNAPVEYIVVGSGAGGGPLACRLALAGHKVMLFEAGGDHYPDSAAVPPFAAVVTEDPLIQWNYWVRHYADTERQRKDTKYIADKDPDGTGGIYYPRVGALGGCTIHTALIAMAPSESDWEHIAAITGDPSWAPENMRKYFERLEACTYAPYELGNPSRHGFFGWLPTSITDPAVFASDSVIVRFIRAAVEEIYGAVGNAADMMRRFFEGTLDPNDYRLRHSRNGYFNLPLAASKGQRRSVRDFILATATALPNNLIIKKDCLVTRVLFEGTTAIGVEYLEGARLYRADPNPAATAPPAPKQELATREVILSAGAFNSPQLLKLSGIGPADELARHRIPVIVDLPGVGENLQDRYEVGIVTEQDQPFTYAADCTYFENLKDPCLPAWFKGQGPYTSTGVYGAIFHTSETARAAGEVNPDLFVFGAAAQFRGYYPGYAFQDVAAYTNRHTWLILKAHTVNRGGRVLLRSADPRDTPIINFHYFDEGTEGSLHDLAAMVEGVEFVRRISARVAGITNGHVWPGPEVRSREDIAEFVRNEAWGHHASCTNRMGPRTDPMAVVDSEFRVHGTQRLRVVDASIFPRIPGYFILVPIYMISEKAADVILSSAS